MSASFFKSLFEDCKECNKVKYAEISFIKKHFRQKHDYQELLKKADSVGLIDDLTKYHQINYVIEKLVDFSIRRE